MRKALFIGINQYDHVSQLSGCVNDAIAMANVLERHGNGQPNFSSKILTSSEQRIETPLLRTSIQELFKGSCDVALLYFAGHGAFEESIDEGVIIPQNYRTTDDGIRISDILNWAVNANSIRNKIIILDCCQAGSAGDSRELRGGTSTLGEGVTILTACKKDEYASEDPKTQHGLFTSLLIKPYMAGLPMCLAT